LAAEAVSGAAEPLATSIAASSTTLAISAIA
jgi:hypothetical protein